MEIKHTKGGFLALFICLILVLTLLSAGIGVVAAADPIVSIKPVVKEVNVGEDFSVFIEVDPNGNAVETALLDLTYDTTKVSITEVVMNGVDFPINSHGEVTVAGKITKIMGLNTAATGLTTVANLAEIQMHADAAGTFTVGISGKLTKPPKGDPLTPVTMNSGEVRIESSGDSLGVTVLYPNGDESIQIGTQVQVSARATDDSAVTGVTFYYSSGSNWNSIGAGTRVSGTTKDGTWDITWDTNGLSAGTNYKIKAVASDGTSTSEDQSDSAFSVICTQPSTPTLNDPGTTDTDGSYTVSWSSVSGATSYTLEEDTSSSFSSPTVVHSGVGTSKDVSGKSDGTYYYRVNACNAGGCSGWSNIEDITVEITDSQHDLIVTGKILWNESLVANSTHAEIVSDLEGDGNPDVLVYTLRYDPVTDIGTEKVIAKKGSDGSHLWEESVNARGENNSYIIAHSAGDLDGDGLDDVIVTESEYDETADTETAKVIAKIGKTGMPLWEESVNAVGEDNCDIFAVPTDDLDGDGLTDVIVIESIYDRAADTTTAKVIAKKGNTGMYLWEESVNANGKDNCDIDAESAGDLNGDGLGDIIVIESIYDGAANTTTAKVIAMIGNTGTYLWEESVNANGKDNCDIDAKSAGDLDGDGFNDIIVIESIYDGATDTTTARVIAKIGNTGTYLWEETVNADGKDNCDIDAERAGDLDGDGFEDVIVRERKSNEAIFTATMSVIAKKGMDGTQMWEESVTGMVPFIYVLPAGDLDGDGLNDVIVSEIKVDETTFTAMMCVIAKKGSNGASLWEESVSGTGSHIFALPAGDLDGDGLDDVIVIESKYDKTTDTTTVRIIAKNGKTGTHMWEESVSGAGSYIAALPAGDLDGDGLNDVIATENKYDQLTDTTTTRVIAKTGKEGTHLLEAQSNELIWVATWWGHNCDLNGDGTNDLLLGISTEMYALTCLYGTNTFDTRQSANPYPSIPGTHTGTITQNQDITVQKLYTYPCASTGGHTESVRISGNNLDESASWNGYGEGGHTITFDSPFTLEAGKTYNYVIITGSYPQIHHTDNLSTPAGFITCSEFRDVNGKIYSDWIPAIRLT